MRLAKHINDSFLIVYFQYCYSPRLIHSYGKTNEPTLVQGPHFSFFFRVGKNLHRPNADFIKILGTYMRIF